ncbi:MAG: hypothetical protein MJ211_00825 [Bacteroidales bacterium]|nr:hypothetical protein [Bacteroidales bacterium]
MKTKFVLIFVLIITLISCNDTAKKSYDLFAQWTNKKIEFPQDINFYTTNKDNNILEVKSKVKLLRYIDSSGCSSCKLKLEVWNNFIKQIMKLSDNKCPTIITFNPKDDIIQTRNFKTILKTSGFDYPIFIDYNDSLNILNNFPSDERFHCFLLDENNRVILIGNPVQNPKIKDLYIRTICERLGIDTTNINIAENQKENRFSFGRFPFSDTMKTQFV